MTNPEPKPVPAIVFLGMIVAAIGMNWFLFRLFGGKYFLWYLKNGPIISLATGFLAPTWTSMKARLGLISSHPAAYIAACHHVLGTFLVSIRPLTSSEKSRPKDIGVDIGLNGAFAKVFDRVLYLVLTLLMVVLGFSWIVLVAPLAYFVTLIAGVPARQALRGRIPQTFIRENLGQVTLVEPQDGETPPKESSDLSFARDPFVITQAASAVVLWVAGLLYSRFS